MTSPRHGRRSSGPAVEAVRRHIRNGRLHEAKVAAKLLSADAAAGAMLALGRSLECAAGGVAGRLVLGVALREQARLAEAEQVLRDGLAVRPAEVALLLEFGNLLADLDRPDEAIKAFERIIRLNPGYMLAHYNLGNMLRQAGRLEDAVAAYEAALRLKPDYAAAHYNLGISLQRLGQSERAVAAYRRAAELRPAHAGTFFNLGIELRAQGRLTAAVAALRQAVALAPDYPEAYHNLGHALRNLKRLDEAAAAYRRALAERPGYRLAQINLARVLTQQRNLEEAEELCRDLLRKQPDDPEAAERLAEVLRAGGGVAEARAVYEAILARRPDHAEALAQLLHLKSQVCDWRGRDEDLARLVAVTERQIDAGQRTALSAFDAMGRPLPPEMQLAIARSWSAEIQQSVAPVGAALSFVFDRKPKDRLRIAYVSSDFCNHAIGHLVQGLFGAHDRAGFEAIAVSHGRDDGSVYRTRIAESADRFIDVSAMTDHDAALCLYREGIDILVDLNGVTRDHRLGIAALRPAPITAAYLGFPGSSGASFIDYVIADHVVAPEGEAARFTEKLIRLPHCYQINDPDHPVDPTPLSRGDVGLPDAGIVFCCFNAGFKIEPFIFDLWMRILRQVPQSALWLLRGPREMADNLAAEAVARGVDPARLVFAAPWPKTRHLARLRLADLFLDTRYYTAHTTCSDALLAGLPVLTCAGGSFASRVAASLLAAAGLPDLILPDFAAYEARAVALAQQPRNLQRLRERLLSGRSSCPAFDAARLVRNLERAYRQIWRNYAAGNPPRELTVVEE